MAFMKWLWGILLLLSFLTATPEVFAFNVAFIPQKVVGQKAWDFTLPTVQGKEFKLSESIAGKKTIIFFWATWCPYCRKQLKLIHSFSKEFNKKEINLVLVSAGESKSAVEKYLRRNRYDYDVVLDYKESLGELYPFPGIPALFFVDEKGYIKALFHSLPKDYQKYF